MSGSAKRRVAYAILFGSPVWAAILTYAALPFATHLLTRQVSWVLIPFDGLLAARGSIAGGFLLPEPVRTRATAAALGGLVAPAVYAVTFAAISALHYLYVLRP